LSLSQIGPWLALIRFKEYGPFFILCGAAGALYAGVGTLLPLAGVLLFIGFFSTSAFVLNDVADWRLDSAPGSRNPISLGTISRASALGFFVVLAAASLASLLVVPPPALYAAPLVYALYWGYSVGPAFKSRPILDVAVHGSVPGLFVVMGYAAYAPPSAGSYLLGGVVFCLAGMSEVLQEVRDLAKDTALRRTTASYLGQRGSADLALGLFVSSIALLVVAEVTQAVPIWLVLLTPLAYLIASPLLSLRAGKTEVTKAISAVRVRGLLLAGALILSYLALVGLRL
jgi:4-hydroxybenzoate polyprenyltransferase